MKKLKEQNSLNSNFKGDFMNQLISSGSFTKEGGDAMSQFVELSKEIPEEVIRKTKKKNDMKKLVGNTKMSKPIGKLYSIGKTENKEATGSGSAGGYEQPLFSTTKKEVEEKWSKKYKDSIDCNNPKGFSQKAHCQGKKKKNVSEEKLKGGKSDNKSIEDLVKKYKKIKDAESKIRNQVKKGTKVEKEHTKDTQKAKEISMDHVYEDPKYYDKLKKIETKEATGSSSSGSYVTPAAWAKSTKKKDWRGRSKTQIPGGKFVQVKKKCKTFPYCNQGDIKALNIFDSVQVKRAIKEVSESYGISEQLIKNIMLHELTVNKSN